MRGPDGMLFDITPSIPSLCEGGSSLIWETMRGLAMKTPNLEIRCQGNCPSAPLDPELYLQRYVPEAAE
jgi:hypothetical protein